ncbi:methylenetetrahydrofolate reductase [Luteimicrobium subarcticum]|uniref:Methylenetetrahydrofolate reductase n=1 Tax=Luteimicrobium subarcticum TaxID=620910 RepID=A0A2M8WJ95_9MICO|nr:methylenetetrahydrofolate reductase [Luteimicrobium subarcticum]PJI91007.1 methylenetetrahydrofolate reductase (NADPH) [Luteimicrobium subarcticum]
MSVGPAIARAGSGTAPRPTVSFELMPPRNPAAAPKFWDTATRLVAARPDFVSVTYGAAGNDRDTARHVVARLIRETPVVPVAHLTCVGAARGDVAEVIDDFLADGVRSFLALRGDPPVDKPDWAPAPDGLRSSDDLVHLLREVEARRCASHPGDALRGAHRPLTIAVAAFPAGNLAAGTTRAQEVQRLLEKEQAGADFAITQICYEPETYTGFVDEARAAGVTIPILAGILPMTEPRRLHRVEELTGVPVPQHVLPALEAADDDAARHAIGVRHTVDLAQAVLDAGAPGLHVYTFNKHHAALDLLEGVHLGGRGTDDTSDLLDLASGPWVRDHHPHDVPGSHDMASAKGTGDG